MNITGLHVFVMAKSHAWPLRDWLEVGSWLPVGTGQ